MKRADLRISDQGFRTRSVAADADVEFSKMAPERLLGFVGELLIAKEQDQMIHQRGVELFDLTIAERPRQIDFADLGANVRGDRRYLDRLIVHSRSLHAGAASAFTFPDGSGQDIRQVC